MLFIQYFSIILMKGFFWLLDSFIYNDLHIQDNIKCMHSPIWDKITSNDSSIRGRITYIYVFP